MKKIAITALSATIIATGISALYAESTYYEPSKEAIVAKQEQSTAMRTKYYNEYKAKGYDMSSLEAYLDATKSTESEFWAAFKVIKDKKEIPERREFVAKLQAKGYDVSGFTEAIISDSGKFWEMVKKVETMNMGANPPKDDSKKPEPIKSEDYKKVEPVKQEYKKEEMIKKEVEKKMVMPEKQDEKKAVSSQKIQEKVTGKFSSLQAEKLQTAMKARIAKLPSDTRDATLAKLETALIKNIEMARTRNAKLLVARYEILLSVVQEEMDSVDDEALIDGLFK